MDKIETKRKRLNDNAARYFYRKHEEVLQRQRDEYDSVKEYKKVAKQLRDMYDAIASN